MSGQNPQLLVMEEDNEHKTWAATKAITTLQRDDDGSVKKSPINLSPRFQGSSHQSYLKGLRKPGPPYKRHNIARQVLGKDTYRPFFIDAKIQETGSKSFGWQYWYG